MKRFTGLLTTLVIIAAVDVSAVHGAHAVNDELRRGHQDLVKGSESDKYDELRRGHQDLVKDAKSGQ